MEKNCCTGEKPLKQNTDRYCIEDKEQTNLYCLNVRYEKINVEREIDTYIVFLLLEMVVLERNC
jgi:hypothetical protein